MLRHARPFFSLVWSRLQAGFSSSQNRLKAELQTIQIAASQLTQSTARLLSPTEVIDWHWLFTLSLAVLTVSKRATITTQRASPSLIMTPKPIASCAGRCSSFPVVIRRFPASSKTENLYSQVGAIRFVVERSTTDEPCARQNVFIL